MDKNTKMSTDSLSRQATRTRNAFLRAAYDLILQDRYDSVNVSDIARLADYGRSTFYLHFKDKEDLIWVMLKDQVDTLNQRILEVVHDLKPPEREWRAWVLMFENIASHREFFLRLDGEYSRRLRQLQKDYIIAVFEVQYAEELTSLMVEVPPGLAARFTAGAMLEILEYWLHHPELGNAEDVARYFFRMTYRAEPPG